MATHMENRLMRKLAKSDSMWAASVSMARLLDRYPPGWSHTHVCMHIIMAVHYSRENEYMYMYVDLRIVHVRMYVQYMCVQNHT